MAVGPSSKKARLKSISPGIAGDLPDILENVEGLYKGNLAYYLWVTWDYATNLGNSYHNFRHPFHALWRCYDACKYYKSVLSPLTMRKLLIGIIMHDFNHSGHNDLKDCDQISRAIAGLYEYVADEDRESVEDIAALIRATEYPHRSLAELGLPPELELPAQIMRDADLSQALGPAWIQEVVFGLAEEWGTAPLKILEMQEEFIRGLPLYTEWARELFKKEVLDAKIREAQRLLTLLRQGKEEYGAQKGILEEPSE